MEQQNETQAAVLGKRIREAREHLRWSQSRLATEVGFNSAQIISSVESGTREVKASELSKIARALRTTIDNLLNPELRPEPRFAWREQPERSSEEHESLFLLKCERYGFLEKWCNQVSQQQLPALKFKSASPSFNDIRIQADNIRHTLQLGGRPACSLEKTLEEDYGVKIFYADLGSNGGSGCSIESWFGTAVLLNSREAPWRRNFSLAHELFHLLVKNDLDDCGKVQIEKLANAFASGLLLPSDHVMTALDARVEDGKISYENLVEIAREFAVSIDALLYRLSIIGRIPHEKAKELLSSEALRAIDKASFPKWGDPPQFPDRYVRLCHLAYRQGKIGLAKLAEFLETSIVDLAEQVYESGAELAAGEEAEIAVAGC